MPNFVFWSKPTCFSIDWSFLCVFGAFGLMRGLVSPEGSTKPSLRQGGLCVPPQPIETSLLLCLHNSITSRCTHRQPRHGPRATIFLQGTTGHFWKSTTFTSTFAILHSVFLLVRIPKFMLNPPCHWAVNTLLFNLPSDSLRCRLHVASLCFLGSSFQSSYTANTKPHLLVIKHASTAKSGYTRPFGRSCGYRLTKFEAHRFPIEGALQSTGSQLAISSTPLIWGGNDWKSRSIIYLTNIFYSSTVKFHDFGMLLHYGVMLFTWRSRSKMEANSGVA